MDQGSGFEAVFLDPVGQAVQQRWADAAMTVAFEEQPPVSAFPVVPGRRWGPGLWWSATTRRHVAAGSNAMRVQLMVLDRDPNVTGLAGRPVRLLWHNPRGQVRSWVPQLFARRADGTAMLADCPSHPDSGGERARKAAEAVAQACAHPGWTYRRLPPLDARPTWPDILRMDHTPALPHQQLAALDERLAGAAARPVVLPETIVVDRGKVFVSAAFTAACERPASASSPPRPAPPPPKASSSGPSAPSTPCSASTCPATPAPTSPAAAPTPRKTPATASPNCSTCSMSGWCTTTTGPTKACATR
ncbi:hypothetical protein GCM10010260_30250 [Streptomyces filipinensis]|uniref:Transposase n=1 Tax=Streptomyces filipinensis TaxID=66887 RepID=A0A918MAB9_9ACTN|nr:TnsA-like heteromeric transposase endonuclease subunit [Streptomyces filipinensis]GGU93306.1 hypothetical protein GCM10010260_30250 [Streptomyces filipinensis]